MLMASQMIQVFGPALEQGELHYLDWATERVTYSTLDRVAPVADHVEFANGLLLAKAEMADRRMAGISL